MRLPAPLARGVTRSVLRAGFKLPSSLPLPLPFMRRLLDAGALILALAVALRDRGQPLPAGLVMISPYLDLTLSLPSVTANAGRDPMTTAIALRRGGDAWRGGIAAGDPRVSPLHADLRGLPPVLVQAGEDEILLDDARVFAERALAAGVPTDLHIYPGMWHNFQMFNALIAPAEQALDEIGLFIRQH